MIKKDESGQSNNNWNDSRLMIVNKLKYDMKNERKLLIDSTVKFLAVIVIG